MIKSLVLLVGLAGGLGPPQAFDCRVCHQEIYEQWSRSWHAKSSTNHNFQVALQRWAADGKSATTCLDCHAGESIITEGLTVRPIARTQYLEEGVNCNSCHGGFRGAMHGPYETKASHPTVENKAFLTVNACVACHGQPDSPCQNQVGSLLESALRGRVTCQSCHMPAKREKLVQLINIPEIPIRKVGDHSFPGVHDEKTLNSAMSASVSVEGGQVVVSLENTGSGHSVPASPWRKLIARVQVYDEIGRVVHEKRDGYFYQRRNRLRPKEPGQISFAKRSTYARVRVRLYYLFYYNQPMDEGDLILDKEFVL